MDESCSMMPAIVDASAAYTLLPLLGLALLAGLFTGGREVSGDESVVSRKEGHAKSINNGGKSGGRKAAKIIKI